MSESDPHVVLNRDDPRNRLLQMKPTRDAKRSWRSLRGQAEGVTTSA